ncbi:MAG TPA: UvrD-helicase domain-containing protein [Thermoanaerobaculia bacterium]|jgi:superfamily I DNA/RNA helicase/mRNA-degrading endonuclease RelE of RelBE toxin-antitoxin system
MDFRIADTFTDSLARLTVDEQKAVKTTAFDLQMNPAQPGMQLHKLEKGKDPNFWSVRVGQDIRLIVHRTASSLMLCYVDHHDAAYRWAERRKIDRHPTTGAAQLVEVRETVREIVVPRYVEAAPEPLSAKRLFDELPEWVLLTYGVPQEWIADVRSATDESLLDIADHLPREAAEALLDLAVGLKPPAPPPFPIQSDAFEHPDAQRRFRVVRDVEELERALDAPWEKWIVFLHPAQRALVERHYSGPVRVFGSAGTGKTIVALHRADYLARSEPDSRVLLTTFSEPLARSLRSRLRLLLGNEPRTGERLEVQSIGSIGRRLFAAQLGPASIASPEEVRVVLAEAVRESGSTKFGLHFLWTEWANVVDAWQLSTWEEYRDVKRLGRRIRLSEGQRAGLWPIFDRTRALLQSRGLMSEAEMFTRLAERLTVSTKPVFDYAIIDEAQDLSVAEMRFIRSLGAARPHALFFAGDLGQRIFQQPFSWKELGVDVRGRATRLRINYRTSHQIRRQADRLLAFELSDVDGITEDRRATISAFNGVTPDIEILDSVQAESERVTAWIKERLSEGVQPHEIALFVRSPEELSRGQAVAEKTSASFVTLDERLDTQHGRISLMMMHLAKGLEFRVVVAMACDEDVIPLQSRLETAADESELEDVYQTERHLLYVACTRARDRLLVTGVAPGSEFLHDLKSAGSEVHNR